MYSFENFSSLCLIPWIFVLYLDINICFTQPFVNICIFLRPWNILDFFFFIFSTWSEFSDGKSKSSLLCTLLIQSFSYIWTHCFSKLGIVVFPENRCYLKRVSVIHKFVFCGVCLFGVVCLWFFHFFFGGGCVCCCFWFCF